MSGFRSWLFRVSYFFVQHGIFIKFLIVLCVYVDGVATGRGSGLFSGIHSELMRLMLVALFMASLPDVLVVAVGHPQSRRSQLVLCAVVMVMSVCICLFRGSRVGLPVAP